MTNNDGGAMDEREARAQVLEAAVNFRSLLTVTATLMRKGNPRVAGALYVLEREVYDAGVELALEWREPEREDAPAKAAAKAKRCRHVFDDTGCTKCGEARQRKRKAKSDTPASETP